MAAPRTPPWSFDRGGVRRFGAFGRLTFKSMRNHVCWMCKGTTSHRLIHDPTKANLEEATGFSADANHYVAALAYQCTVCGGISVGITNVPNNVAAGASLRNWAENIANLSDDDFTWRPRANDTQDYPDVPPHIADAATEAFECNSEGHYRAAILLSRSVIEATAKDKGITTGNLKSKIEEMANQQLIRPHIKAVADGIRDYGNEMAHGDFADPVAGVDSALIIELMGEILEEVYQSPARDWGEFSKRSPTASRAAHSSDPPAGRPQDLRAMPIPANDPLKHFRRSSAVLPRMPRPANTDKRPGRSSRCTSTPCSASRSLRTALMGTFG
jgi:hypothetical protein